MRNAQPEDECRYCGDRLGEDVAAWLNGMHEVCKDHVEALEREERNRKQAEDKT